MSFGWQSDALTPLADMGLPSKFYTAMEEVFGQAPWTLHTEALPVLVGMAAADRDNRKAYRLLHGAIETHGTIYLRVL